MITLNGKPVVFLSARFPLSGRHNTTVHFSADEPDDEGKEADLLTGAVTLADTLGETDDEADAGLTATAVSCTIKRIGRASGLVSAMVYGGAGFDASLDAKNYRDVTVKDVLADIIGGAGVKLSSACDKGALAASLPFWTRTAGTGAEALSILAADTAVASASAGGSASWRVLDDGSLYFGGESWPEQKDYEATELDTDGAISVKTFGVTDLRLRPGVTWRGLKVSRVEYSLSDAESLRAAVYYEP